MRLRRFSSRSKDFVRLVMKQTAGEYPTDDGKIKAAMCAAVGRAGRGGQSATWREVHLQSAAFVCVQSGAIPGASAPRVTQRDDT